MNARRFLYIPLLCTFAVLGCSATTDPGQDEAEDESDGVQPASTEEAQEPLVLGESHSELRKKRGHIHCHTLSTADWYIVTGQYSKYGGTLCH
jgi:hypothetical protein